MYVNFAEDWIILLAILCFVAFFIYLYLNGKKNSQSDQEKNKENDNQKNQK